MDPFTQRMLEKAEQRSRALGISKFSMSENREANSASAIASQPQEQQQMQRQQQKQKPVQSPSTRTTKMRSADSDNGNNKNCSQLQVVEKTLGDAVNAAASPNKVMRHFSAVDKENVEMGIEINIMTDKNVEVQVQVEEQDTTTDDEALSNHGQAHQIDIHNQPVANIRDTSRNRLQRLGALYSNPNDLSSPIHRTEGNFHAGLVEDDGLDTSPKRPKQRYGKLAALANTINLWEDDTAHPQQQTNLVPPPKPALPSRRLVSESSKKPQAPQPPIASSVSQSPLKASKARNEMAVEHIGDSVGNKTKQLKWDPKVINSLEAQGFQRRESSTVKLAYNYDKEYDEKYQNQQQQPPEEMSKPTNAVKVANTFTVASSAAVVPKAKAAVAQSDKKIHTVKPGLVSGRAAAFENKAASVSHQPQRPQKDPTELSLRERMQLFERNKGEALVPKAALGMAPSITQIRQDNALHAKKDELKACQSASTVASVKVNADTKVRNKVAALVASATTISENKIKADIQKQREEDMQILANRFNKQKEIFTKDQLQQQEETELKQTQSHAQMGAPGKSATNKIMRPPPPPPPMPSTMTNSANALYSKRRSPSNAIDDESKRPRTTSASNAPIQHLYPALSEFDSNESFTEDNVDCATTATISGDDLNQRRSAVADASAAKTTEEATDESYMESEDADEDDSSVGICDGSLGREVMHAVQKNDQQKGQQQGQRTKIKEVRYANKNLYYGDDGNCVDSSMNSSEGSVGVDDYLDEAFDDGDDDCTQESGEDGNTSAESKSRALKMTKGTTTSNSFTFRKTPRKYSNYQTISEEKYDLEPSCSTINPNNPASFAQQQQPIKSELSINQEDESMVTLVHTVSFYRRQQNANSANCTPVRCISREQQVQRSEYAEASDVFLNETAAMQRQQPSARELFISGDGDFDDDDADTDMEAADNQAHIIQERIKELLDEVCKQQQIIAQTSQALNLCAATVEFSGSTESVEGERHLLVATHRRQSCLDEVQRLRVEKCLRPPNAPKERGRLVIKEITVPLRQDYIRKLAADTISGHHLVCLLKYNDLVVATKTVPTLPGLLAVKFPDTLHIANVYTDFRITLEIYGMTAQREVLPHEVKYHINLGKKCIKTPKKKGSDNRLVMPPVQSPAGPNVVRTPALVQYGFAIFSLRESQRTTWTLTQVLGVSPLEGVLHMKINCEISVKLEFKGFLTMFEDISGFGAWHRRWCHLSGTVLNYWKYPDDEMKKAPMGTIDLRACISRNATCAPRDICARMNTILLECQRPAKDTDQESLIIVPNGPVTIVRHLLSADTKIERDMWCHHLSKALALLRAWGPSSP